MIAPAYHRSLLSPVEQRAYTLIVKGLLNRSPSIFVPGTCAHHISTVVQAVHLDHPELFYVDFYHYRIVRFVPAGLSLQFSMMLGSEASRAVLNTLSAKAESMLALQGIPAEQAYARIAREIASAVEYMDTNSAFWDHTAACLVCHSAVCEGMAKLFLFLCQRLSLPCALISGALNGAPHAWNMVEAQDTIRYIDVTNCSCLSLLPICSDLLFQSEQQIRRRGYEWPPVFAGSSATAEDQLYGLPG